MPAGDPSGVPGMENPLKFWVLAKGAGRNIKTRLSEAPQLDRTALEFANDAAPPPINHQTSKTTTASKRV